MSNIALDRNAGGTDFAVVTDPYVGDLGAALAAGVGAAGYRFVRTTEDLAVVVAAEESLGKVFVLQEGTHVLTGTVTVTFNRVRIAGAPGSLVSMALNAGLDAIEVVNAQDVELVGFRIEVNAADRDGVRLTGVCNGAHVHNLNIQKIGGPSAGTRGVHFVTTLAGCDTLRVHDCVIEGQFETSIEFEAANDSAWRRVFVYGNKCSGAASRYVRVNAGNLTWFEDAVVSGNIFEATGVNPLRCIEVICYVANRITVDGNVMAGTATAAFLYVAPTLAGGSAGLSAASNAVGTVGYFGLISKVSDVAVTGNSAVAATATFLYADSGDRATITGNICVSANSGVTLATWAEEAVVSGNIFVRSAAGSTQQGLNLTVGQEIVAQGNILFNYGEGIVVSSDVVYLTIQNNIVLNTRKGIRFSNTGATSRNGTVSGNVVTAQATNSGEGIYLEGGTDWVVSSNRVVGFDDISNQAGIRLQAAAGAVSITNNHVESCFHGISIGSSTGTPRPITVRGNSIISCASTGIYISAASTKMLAVQNNSVTNNCALAGIYVLAGTTEGTLVQGNHVYTVTGIGIQILSAPGEHLSCCENVVVGSSSATASIQVQDQSRTVVSGNVVADGAGDGIRLLNVDESIISGNRVEGNLGVGKFGIYEDASCDQNLYVGNHLRGNTAATSFNGTNRVTSANKV